MNAQEYAHPAIRKAIYQTKLIRVYSISFGGNLAMSPCCCGDREATNSDVVDAINDHDGEKIRLEDLADGLGIDEEDLRSIIVHLRAKGEAKVEFDRQTGELIIGEPKEPSVDMTALSFCPYCGHHLQQGARFCSSCGSSLD